MTETELTSEVMRLCDELGLLYHHCPNSSRCKGQRGFPDLVIAGRGGVIFAELKSDHGETSAEQDLWAWTLSEAAGSYGCDTCTLIHGAPSFYRLWRPEDLEAIQLQLERMGEAR